MALADVVHEAQEPAACAYDTVTKHILLASCIGSRYAGILSAYGMALADVVHEAQEPAACAYDSSKMNILDVLIATDVIVSLVSTVKVKGSPSTSRGMRTYGNFSG